MAEEQWVRPGLEIKISCGSPNVERTETELISGVWGVGGGLGMCGLHTTYNRNFLII